LVNNPVIFGATAASAHDNLTFSNNILGGTNGYGILALSLDVAAFTGNDIDSDSATGLSFDGADANVTVTGNLFHDGARAVRVRAPQTPSRRARQTVPMRAECTRHPRDAWCRAASNSAPSTRRTGRTTRVRISVYRRIRRPTFRWAPRMEAESSPRPLLIPRV